MALLPVAVAVGIAAELTSAGAKTQVKWPNDLVLGDRKLGGILVEMSAGTPVVGIGVNVGNPVPAGFAALRGWDVEVVGDLVLAGVQRGLATLDGGAAAVIDAFATVDWLFGKAVLLDGAPAEGRACGIDAAGCLLLADAVGAVSRACSGQVVSVAGVEWARQT